MILIKQGKTNIKYLLVVLILATIIGGGVLWLTKKEGAQFTELLKIETSEKATELDIDKYLHEDAILGGIEMPPEAGYKGISPEEAIRFALQYLENNGVKEIKICETKWIVAPLGGFLIDGFGDFIIKGKAYSTFRIGIRDGSEGDAGKTFAFIARGEDEKGNVIWYPEPGPNFQPVAGEAFPEELMVYEFLIDRERFESLSDRFMQEEDETTNWKTYRNEDFGFLFDYPKTWEISAESRYQRALCQDEQYRKENPEARCDLDLPLVILRDANHTYYLSINGRQCHSSIPLQNDNFICYDAVLSAEHLGKYLTPDEGLALLSKETRTIIEHIQETFVALSDWKTYRNEEYGFEMRYPENWLTEDHLTATSCCLNIFNSVDPYPDEGFFLGPDVMKAQFQYHVDELISSKQDYIDHMVKESEGPPNLEFPKGTINRDWIRSFVNENGVNVLEFSEGKLADSYYVIAISNDFSETLHVLVWNPDIKFNQILSTFRFLK